MGKRSGNFKITKRNKKKVSKQKPEELNNKRIIGYCNEESIYGSHIINKTYINYDNNIYEISLIKKKYIYNNFPVYKKSMDIWGNETPYSLIHVFPQRKCI